MLLLFEATQIKLGIIEKMPRISKDLVNHILIDEAQAGQRLDNYLIKILKGVPKSHIQRIIRSGEVRINKARAKADNRLKTGDHLRIPPIRIADKKSEMVPIPVRQFEIVYEDEGLLVINKPSGVAVHGGSGVSFGVIEQLRQSRPQARYLELVHRLDRDTSGLLMIAKKRSVLVKLHEQLRHQHPKKVYWALGVGEWAKDLSHVKLPLTKYTGVNGEKMVRVDENGQPSHSVFDCLACFRGKILHSVGISHLSLVEVTLKTGRTHQIRVHMQAHHCPIAGDERYGDYALNKRLHKLGLKRMFLHAHKLEFPHPVSGEVLSLVASLPPELDNFLTLLKNT